MELIENIDHYCEMKGISHKEFERMCGIPNSAVHKWRVGVHKSQSTKSLNRIAEATGIPIWRWMAKGGV